MATKQIKGAVSIGNRTYRAGQEADFEKAVNSAPKDAPINLEYLTHVGAVEGFESGEGPSVEAVNKQRQPGGKFADPSAAKEAKAEEASAAKAAKRSRKK